MRLPLAVSLVLLPIAAHGQPGPSPLGASPSAQCRAAIAATERATGVPDRLMQAIGVIESGRRDETGMVSAWPWTINVEGAGQVFQTKAEAIAAVSAHRARGARSIDVGCMQINLLHHGDAFASLEEAFDPIANARYAAKFLLRLLAQTGSWPRATAGYHSLTPDIGAEYARKVLAIWARPERTQPLPASGPAAILASAAPQAPIALPSSVPARIIPLPGAATPGPGGRGLDAYRAAPTQLAARIFAGRG